MRVNIYINVCIAQLQQLLWYVYPQYILPSVLNVLPSNCVDELLKCDVKTVGLVLMEYFSNGKPLCTRPTVISLIFKQPNLSSFNPLLRFQQDEFNINFIIIFYLYL